MSDIRIAAELEAARPTIERLLRLAFEQLDALTPDAEIRRRLYACLISRAANTAEERLPGSDAVREAIAEIFAVFHQQPGQGLFCRQERCMS